MLVVPNPAEFKFAYVNATTEGGENTIVAAPGEGKSIVVLGYVLSASAEGAYVLKTSSATHAKLNVAKGGGASFAGSFDCPAFKCAANKALVLETPASSKAFGHLTYVTV
ncbi:MAG: hypothetical protein JSS68_15060 [Actinobacteria bacterium]|nr:hypothetical protein [Actinomycetota bacterium]